MDVKLVVMTHKKKQRKRGTGGQTMSDDLISRKAVLNILTEARVKDSILCSPAFVEMLTQRIKKIPTAFDKENVINEIRNVPHGYYNTETENEIIKIVEKGGIE